MVGTGGIGAEMVKLGSALGMKVIAWNRSGISSHLPCKEFSLDELFGAADVVSLHLSLTNDTKGLVSARRLALLDQNAILINTARAGLVDESALIEALRAERISHAALDVFTEEPLPRAHPPHPSRQCNAYCSRGFYDEGGIGSTFAYGVRGDGRRNIISRQAVGRKKHV